MGISSPVFLTTCIFQQSYTCQLLESYWFLYGGHTLLHYNKLGARTVLRFSFSSWLLGELSKYSHSPWVTAGSMTRSVFTSWLVCQPHSLREPQLSFPRESRCWCMLRTREWHTQLTQSWSHQKCLDLFCPHYTVIQWKLYEHSRTFIEMFLFIECM